MSVITLALCKHGDSTAVSPIYDHTTFDFIREFSMSRWSNLSLDGVSMYYSIPGNERCELFSQDDYNNMVSLVKIYGLKTVDIVVYERGQCSGNVVPSSTAIVPFENTNSTEYSNSPILDGLDFDDELYNDSGDEIDDQIHVLSSDAWKTSIVGLHQDFVGGSTEFKNALIKFSIVHGFEFKFLKNTDLRVKAVCSRQDIGCKWSISASSDKCGVFYIRKFEPNHTCACGFMIRKSKRLSAEIIGQEICDKIKRNPLYKPYNLLAEFPKSHGCYISYSLAYNAVEKAKEKLFGDYYLSYEETRLYLEAAREANPGSHFIMDIDPISKRFKRMFVSFHASIVGFRYCRPMLFLDATFLTGRFRGQLLCATGKDGNNGLYLLAFGIVDSENIDNWTWFMEQLRVVLNNDREITFISDRHKGLIESVSTVFPGFPHGYCTVHLKNNLRNCMAGKPAPIKEGILKIFDKVTYASTVQRFEEKLAALKAKGGQRVSDFIESISPEHFSHAFFRGNRYGEVTSNAAESLNNMLKVERQLPILGLVDGIRVKLMKQFARNRDIANSWKFKICPRIQKQINITLEYGITWSVDISDDYTYEVCAKKSVVVNLAMHTCTCRGWQINQFPCSHALTVINRYGLDFSSFVDEYYHVQSYSDSYQLPIYPVPTFDIPPATRKNAQVLPPISKSQPGRRRAKRILSKGEPVRKYNCRRCGKIGHNKKGCRERVEETL